MSAEHVAGSSALAGWLAALFILTVLLVAGCHQRKQVRAALQAGGMAPKRAKIDPNAFGGVSAGGISGAGGEEVATGAEAEEVVVRPRSPTLYCHGRKRLASVMPEPEGAAAAATTAEATVVLDASPSQSLVTKSIKTVREAVILRSGGGGAALLSGAGPRSDRSAPA